MNKLKEMVISQPHTAPCKILSEVKAQFPKVCQALTDDANLARNIRRWRQPLGQRDAKLRFKISLTEDQKTDKEGHTFLYDDKDGTRDILIFTTDDNLGIRHMHIYQHLTFNNM